MFVKATYSTSMDDPHPKYLLSIIYYIPATEQLAYSVHVY